MPDPAPFFALPTTFKYTPRGDTEEERKADIERMQRLVDSVRCFVPFPDDDDCPADEP